MKKSIFAVLLLSLFLAGCAGSGNDSGGQNERRAYTPQPGRALLVFMRPGKWQIEERAQIFDITTGEWAFVASIAGKTKIAHNLTPGRHRFMVIGENADFMDADLVEGRTYYVKVVPRIGARLPRFGLEPVHEVAFESNRFAQWHDVTRWVEGPLQWERSAAKRDAARIKKLHDAYLPKWLRKEKKPVLLPEDGQ